MVRSGASPITERQTRTDFVSADKIISMQTLPNTSKVQGFFENICQDVLFESRLYIFLPSCYAANSEKQPLAENCDVWETNSKLFKTSYTEFKNTVYCRNHRCFKTCKPGMESCAQYGDEEDGHSELFRNGIVVRVLHGRISFTSKSKYFLETEIRADGNIHVLV